MNEEIPEIKTEVKNIPIEWGNSKILFQKGIEVPIGKKIMVREMLLVCRSSGIMHTFRTYNDHVNCPLYNSGECYFFNCNSTRKDGRYTHFEKVEDKEINHE